MSQCQLPSPLSLQHLLETHPAFLSSQCLHRFCIHVHLQRLQHSLIFSVLPSPSRTLDTVSFLSPVTPVHPMSPVILVHPEPPVTPVHSVSLVTPVHPVSPMPKAHLLSPVTTVHSMQRLATCSKKGTKLLGRTLGGSLG